MNVIFRVDASIQIGSGHLMRDITLAGALRERESKVSFICRELPGNLCEFVEEKGFKVYRLPYITALYNNCQSPAYTQWLGASWEKDAEQTRAILVKEENAIDWLIIDHYALDKEWEMQMRPYVKKIMVIDDLINRQHDCDLLLDQNISKFYDRYDKLVPRNCVKLTGLAYTLIRKEFLALRELYQPHGGETKKLMVFFGGSDFTDETTKVLKAIERIKNPFQEICVVVGLQNPHKDVVLKLARNISNTRCFVQTASMAELMFHADFFIGAGGSTTWERCCLGLPSIVITNAENQEAVTGLLSEKECIYWIGRSQEIAVKDIEDGIIQVTNDKSLVMRLSNNSRRLVDGKGTRRVTAKLFEIMSIRSSNETVSVRKR